MEGGGGGGASARRTGLGRASLRRHVPRSAWGRLQRRPPRGARDTAALRIAYPCSCRRSAARVLRNPRCCRRQRCVQACPLWSLWCRAGAASEGPCYAAGARCTPRCTPVTHSVRVSTNDSAERPAAQRGAALRPKLRSSAIPGSLFSPQVVRLGPAPCHRPSAKFTRWPLSSPPSPPPPSLPLMFEGPTGPAAANSRPCGAISHPSQSYRGDTRKSL